jgi:hypothetical protein
VRWESLFADLEGQFEAEQAAELAAEVVERTRAELARQTLVDRLRASGGHPLVLHVVGGAAVRGTVELVGAGWLLITEHHGSQVVAPIGAVTGISGLPGWAAEPGTASRGAGRLGMGSALRAIARNRDAVRATLVDGATITGRIDRVGADFFEMAAHPPGEPRRAGAVQEVRVVPMAALAYLQADSSG